MVDYINGTILEMLERVKALKTKIPVSKLENCFKTLAALASNELDNNIKGLNRLLSDKKYQVKSNLPHKLIAFQKLVIEIDYLENYIIAALNRSTEEDGVLSEQINKICKEINYPLLSPVASRLSQSYYCIDTKFNHLRVPLLESEFLLHMPDLYHELAHPIISTQDHPSVTPFQNRLGLFNIFIEEYFDKETIEYRRNDGAEIADRLEIYRASWIESWSIELFCDLFGVYTLGPAYAWAHLHLCVKRGGDPFDTPYYSTSSHPADDARMQSIIHGLNLIGFTEEAVKITSYWKNYLKICGTKIDSNFKNAYPNVLLEYCATMALEGVNSIKCNVASKDTSSEIYKLLNTAWANFIEAPLEYIEWEKLQIEKYRV